MKKQLICLVVMMSLLFTNSNINVSFGEEGALMGFINNLLNNFAIHHFLEKRGILVEDKEAYDYADAFLRLAIEKDLATMREMFAKNAVSEIGEEQLDVMLEAFVDYFQADSFTLEVPVGPVTAERWSDGKKLKELEGPLEVITEDNEYRLAIKCVAYDDWNEDNIGIWSVYIIEKAKDTDLEHPYIGDKKYTTGIHLDVKRPD